MTRHLRLPLRRFKIKWNGIPHTDLVVPHGKWQFDENDSFGALLFQMVHTANQMGIPIHEFLELPSDVKAIHMTYSNIMSKMEQVNAQEREDNIRRNSKSKK